MDTVPLLPRKIIYWCFMKWTRRLRVSLFSRSPFGLPLKISKKLMSIRRTMFPLVKSESDRVSIYLNTLNNGGLARRGVLFLSKRFDIEIIFLDWAVFPLLLQMYPVLDECRWISNLLFGCGCGRPSPGARDWQKYRPHEGRRRTALEHKPWQIFGVVELKESVEV